MNRNREALIEISHLAIKAIISDSSEDVLLEALGEIKLLAESFLPKVKEPDGTEAVPPKTDFLTICPGVTLKRFRAGDRVKYIGSNPDVRRVDQHLYEIEIVQRELKDGSPIWSALASIDGLFKYELFAENRNRTEQLAVSCFHRWLKRTRRGCHRNNAGETK